jgi:hypothetical protein
MKPSRNNMSLRRLSTVIVTLALLSGMGPVAVAATGPQAGRGWVAQRPTVAAPASVTAHRAFRVVARSHGNHGRFLLQRRIAGHGWKVVAAKPHRRKAVFHRTEKAAGRIWYRVKVGHRRSTADRVRVKSPVPPPARTELLMSAGRVGGGDGDILVGQEYTVGGTLTKGGRPVADTLVTVERQDPDSGAWTAAGQFRTDGAGEFGFPDSSDQRGLVLYRGTAGAVTGQTVVPVLEVVSMPASVGPGLSMDSRGCTASVAGNSDVVTMALRGTPGSPGCVINAGDWVALTWTLPGTCTPLVIGNLRLSNESSPTANAVRMRASIDADVELTDETVDRGSGTGLMSIGGDPISTLTLRMQVTDGSGDFVGEVVDAHSTCL